MRVIVAAAGTAGHINPALSIANKIKKEEKDSEIIFIRNNKRIRKWPSSKSRIWIKNNWCIWIKQKNINRKLKKII